MSWKSVAGAAVAPAIANRSDDRSYSPRRGWSSSEVKIVGTPGRTLMRADCTSSSTRSTSNTASG
ncbi:hypothetical protein [Microbacterium sp. Se63.02b]|uniref:hypothetical protein n=1 Tax=Microbacterium sp. Se63.02b TaxID=2709304 RepID=UPI0031F6E8AF